MTAEEAIEILERFQNPDPWEPSITVKAFEALEMAIDAIKKVGDLDVVPTETKNLHWKDAWFHMLNGKKIKRPLWKGYWVWENNTIMMHCRDGSVNDIRDTENVAYTMTNIAQRDWMVVEDE